jgi:hypothetical protein
MEKTLHKKYMYPVNHSTGNAFSVNSVMIMISFHDLNVIMIPICMIITYNYSIFMVSS